MIRNLVRTAAAQLHALPSRSANSGVCLSTLLCSSKRSPSFSYCRANFAKKTDFGGVASLGKAGKKKLGKLGPMMEKKVLPVEQDAARLVSHVCGSNLLKDGQDVALRPDKDYPDWLWTIRTGPLPPLEEMDPESKAYWRRVRTMGMRRNNQLAKLKKF